MGIRGIYRELGPGKRVALSKLAAECFERAHRPFRLAIDIAIWQFQNQAARGGTNPAIRTLFYRLVRLLGTPIQPVFVFDGPHKPKFKRNKRSGRGDGIATAQAKRLIRLFGFVTHDAPGEAEAECAFLQKNGIVDAVLSEDVDTIMFGCTRTLRNWSAEGKGAKTPTHVSLYDVQEMNIASLGLDREGMVLVALMSGGDYLPEGVPGCGVKVACEAARGGFGKSLCRLKSSDTDGVRLWRDSLLHELRTNEKNYFRVRHKALTIPEDFPNVEILRYYTHPVVSSRAALGLVESRLSEKTEFHLEALREFTRETFDWDYRIGAIKFIRVLGQGLLVNKLRQCEPDSENWVKKISGRRTHSSCDGESELRLAYIPEEIVPIDLSKEVEEDLSYGRNGLALNSDDEFEAPTSLVEGSQAGPAKVFDVTKPDLAWVLEGIARRSAPKMVQAWEEQQQAKSKSKRSKIPQSSLDTFFRLTQATAAKSAEKPAEKPVTKSQGDARQSKEGFARNKVPQGSLDTFFRLTKATAEKSVEKPAQKPVTKKSQGGAPRSREGFAPPPSPTSMRRLGTPPPMRQRLQKPLGDMSKQSPPKAATNAEDCFSSSSPVTPRPRARAQKGAAGEPIEILSSPPEPAPSGTSSPPVSPTPSVSFAYSGLKDMVHLVQSNVASGSAPQGTKIRLKNTVDVADPLIAPETSQKKLTQTSMDRFTTRVVQPFATRSDKTGTKGKLGSFEGEDISIVSKRGTGESIFTSPEYHDLSVVEVGSPSPFESSSGFSSKHKHSQEKASSQPRRTATKSQRDKNPRPIGKKKLLVPSEPGFFDEIEVSEDEYEERGFRDSGVLKWSDVTVIDLTKEP